MYTIENSEKLLNEIFQARENMVKVSTGRGHDKSQAIEIQVSKEGTPVACNIHQRWYTKLDPEGLGAAVIEAVSVAQCDRLRANHSNTTNLKSSLEDVHCEDFLDSYFKNNLKNEILQCNFQESPLQALSQILRKFSDKSEIYLEQMRQTDFQNFVGKSPDGSVITKLSLTREVLEVHLKNRNIRSVATATLASNILLSMQSAYNQRNNHTVNCKDLLTAFLKEV